MWTLLILACKKPPVTPPTEPPVVAPDLAIDEVMSDNRTVLADDSDPICPEYDDWIELANHTDASVSLAGIFLEDSADSWPLPDIELGPGERALVWADGDPDQGMWHASFKVSKSGETLRLVSGATVLDEVVVPALGPDESFARLDDGMSVTDRPTPGESNERIVPGGPCFETVGFDDHAYPCIPDVAGFDWLAGPRQGLAVVKFDIFDFDRDADRRIVFMDSTFYTLHDQIYLFTVMNGQPFPNLAQYPSHPGDFATWHALDSWAQGQDLESILDADMIRFAGERLYSPYFYREINGVDRTLGVGTIVHREGLWAFELEAADDIDAESLRVYFEVLEEAGPAEFSELKWLIRSSEQEALAQQLEDDSDPLASRLLRYEELSEPGEVEVYNPGLTAGRVKMVRAGEDGLEDSRPDSILVLDEIPDYLPPARALVTNVKQTPLSHVALLARSRGIPNVHVAGVTSDAQWDQWKRVGARVALEVANGEVRAAGMENSEYLTWIQLGTSGTVLLEPADPVEYAVDLDGTNSGLRPIAGGKVAGMDLLVATGLDTPDLPMGLTTRAYTEHMAALPAPNGVAPEGWLAAVLDADPFERSTDTALRYAVVEGGESYLQRYTSAADAQRLEDFLLQHPNGDLTGDLIRAGGLRMWVASATLPNGAVRIATAARFGSVADLGLRFRSSSTVEDIEGFNGAGLYSSHTGFLNGIPSIEDAVRQTFASYWGFEAVEERQQAGVPHLDGAMGVLVHPRFEDVYERANMVLTLTYGVGDPVLEVNAQIGAISVANPPTTCPPVLPEQWRVDGSGVHLLAASTEATEVLDEAELQELYTASIAAAEAWLAAENHGLPAERTRSIVTLDLEARSMLPGWVGSGAERLVIKQARSLDPSVSRVPVEFQDLPAPVDRLARAAVIDRTTCIGQAFTATIDTLEADANLPPDLGQEAFVVQVALDLHEDVLDWTAGGMVSWNHLDLLNATFDGTLDIVDPSVSIGPAGWSIETATGGAMVCETETLWASRDRFLLELF